MPWFYLLYDGYGNVDVGGYYDSAEQAQIMVDSLAEGGTLVSDTFEAADGYHLLFSKRKSILTIDQEGNTIEVDLGD